MQGQIRISPEQMRSKAAQYRTQAEVIEGTIKKMDSLLSELQSEWEGSSSEAYAARFAEVRPGFISAKQLVSDIAQSLDTTASIMEETDTSIASQLRVNG